MNIDDDMFNGVDFDQFDSMIDLDAVYEALGTSQRLIYIVAIDFVT